MFILLCIFAFASSTNFSFPAGNPWNTDISSASVDPNSAAILNFIASTSGGWTSANSFQIDFSMVINYGDNSVPKKSISGSSYGGFYTDCDPLTEFPYDANGYFEGPYPMNQYPTQCGYAEGGGDCHYIFVDQTNNYLWESFSTDLDANGNFQSQCPVIWDMNRLYPTVGRGAFCTSVDAAGYPLAPLLVTADELASGVVNHALRFILPNNKIQANTYVAPASHIAGGTGGANAPPYGTHLRLKSSFNPSSLPGGKGAIAVANALKKYGMYLADGGNIPLTFASDTNTKAKYADLAFDSHGLYGISPTDFEVLTLGTVTTKNGSDCTKQPFDPTATQQYPTPVPGTHITESHNQVGSASRSSAVLGMASVVIAILLLN